VIEVKQGDWHEKFGVDPGWTQITGPGALYFAKAKNGLIKIGQSGDPDRRLRDLQTMSPIPIDMVLVLDGMAASEGALHEWFADSRTHGEWFRPTDRLLDAIEFLTETRPMAHWHLVQLLQERFDGWPKAGR